MEWYKYIYLTHGSEKEAKYNEGDVIWSECDDDAQNDHAVLADQMDRFATKSISQWRKYDGANHDAKGEHRLRQFR